MTNGIQHIFFVKPALIGWSNRKKVSRGSPVEKDKDLGIVLVNMSHRFVLN